VINLAIHQILDVDAEHVRLVAASGRPFSCLRIIVTHETTDARAERTEISLLSIDESRAEGIANGINHRGPMPSKAVRGALSALRECRHEALRQYSAASDLTVEKSNAHALVQRIEQAIAEVEKDA
jgi:hypothetical protein